MAQACKGLYPAWGGYQQSNLLVACYQRDTARWHHFMGPADVQVVPSRAYMGTGDLAGG